MADPKMINLYPSTTSDGKANKLTKVLAKTLFYDGYNFSNLSALVRWMYKDPLKFGNKVRRIGVGMVEYESYTDITGTEFKESIPKRPNWIEEDYGHLLKVKVATVWSELNNADKFDNAGDHAQYVSLMKGKMETVMDLVPYTILLGLAAMIDTTKQEFLTSAPTKSNHKLNPKNPQSKQIFELAFEKLVKQTGAAKFNDDVTWNDFAENLKTDFSKIKNIYELDTTKSSDEEDQVSSKYAQQFIHLVRAISRSVDQLTSPVFSVNNTLTTVPYKAGEESEQTWATNVKSASELVLLMSRIDLLEMKKLYAQGIDLQQILDISGLGIGTIVAYDEFPQGSFLLVDKHFMNVHPMYQGSFKYTNADLGATKLVTHLWFKYGTLDKVPGIAYISKSWIEPAFKKKQATS